MKKQGPSRGCSVVEPYTVETGAQSERGKIVIKYIFLIKHQNLLIVQLTVTSVKLYLKGLMQ
jgi:hypothetical protein